MSMTNRDQVMGEIDASRGPIKSVLIKENGALVMQTAAPLQHHEAGLPWPVHPLPYDTASTMR